MRKLYMKQKVFSIVDRFTVKNEAEEDCYQVEGDFVLIRGKRLHIRDMMGNEVALVKQKLIVLLPQFLVFVNGQQVAVVNKKFTLLKPKYVVDGLGWEVSGNFFEHDYTISDAKGEIVRIHKAWISWGDSYELEIRDDADEALVLAVVLAIDCVISTDRARSTFEASTEH
ncbi:LURP-one-related/scramblase family protein [Pseudobutyrivibrio xylanivorans]|uniref:Uncharacterized protein YxjI n=1 Tax=Pseudobutyrivibrio xylanivorans DSM 14809 TaxID=1123012 RepID=A0A1M6KHF3_PSEXY|nr:LURP-one-related family protein [Pseudobutyrivibrio xylanivorans]SHJ58312.1 Uncharacterized protein YxjI [Pseudobutyrivibrio xylanivorans DSM 14809]